MGGAEGLETKGGEWGTGGRDSTLKDLTVDISKLVAIGNGEIEKGRAKSRDVQDSCFAEENDEQ